MVILGGWVFLMSGVPPSILNPEPRTLKQVMIRGAWHSSRSQVREREIFVDNLLVRVHMIIEMILVDRPCATGV